jgi:hypothetical protein
MADRSAGQATLLFAVPTLIKMGKPVLSEAEWIPYYPCGLDETMILAFEYKTKQNRVGKGICPPNNIVFF